MLLSGLYSDRFFVLYSKQAFLREFSNKLKSSYRNATFGENVQKYNGVYKKRKTL